MYCTLPVCDCMTASRPHDRILMQLHDMDRSGAPSTCKRERTCLPVILELDSPCLCSSCLLEEYLQRRCWAPSEPLCCGLTSPCQNPVPPS